MYRANVMLTEPIMAKLREQKRITGLSMSDLIRRALEQYFEAEEPGYHIPSVKINVPHSSEATGQSSEDSD